MPPFAVGPGQVNDQEEHEKDNSCNHFIRIKVYEGTIYVALLTLTRTVNGFKDTTYLYDPLEPVLLNYLTLIYLNTLTEHPTIPLLRIAY